MGRAYPPRLIIGILALAAFAAAAAAFNLSLSGDYGRNPYVHASLVAWITLSYVLCGLAAWWRRPESRFGPLMVVAGFSPLLSRLSARYPHVPTGPPSRKSRSPYGTLSASSGSRSAGSVAAT